MHQVLLSMLSSMNMILIQPTEIDTDMRVVLADGRARHIRKVLKAEPGKQLRVGVLNGPLGIGTVQSIDDSIVVLDCELNPELSDPPGIDLLLAMPRPKVLKRMWAQLAALGVGRIVLVRAEKVERYYFDSHVVDPEFYNKLLMEGLQQACCTHLPDVLVRPLFKPFIEDELDPLFGEHRKLLADPSGKKRLREGLDAGEARERVVLAIGPEGGWTSYELERLQEKGFELFGMGRRILRSDTATVGLLSMLADSMNDG